MLDAHSATSLYVVEEAAVLLGNDNIGSVVRHLTAGCEWRR